MFTRGLRGAVLGACIAGAIGGIGLGIFVGLQLLYDSDFSKHGWRLLCTIPPLVAVAGVCAGAIAGLAARLPRKGVGLLRSIAIVAGCGLLAALPTAVQPRYKGSPDPSYLPTVLGELVGGVIVFCYGMFATRRATETTDVERGSVRETTRSNS